MAWDHAMAEITSEGLGRIEKKNIIKKYMNRSVKYPIIN